MVRRPRRKLEENEILPNGPEAPLITEEKAKNLRRSAGSAPALCSAMGSRKEERN